MGDLAHDYTEEQIKELDKQIHAVYSEAKKDIQGKLDEFTQKFSAKDAIHLKELNEGKITQEQYNAWLQGQIFQSKQWAAKRDQITETIINSNQIAANIINGKTQNVFGFNASYMNYTLEHASGVNFGFGVYDSATVAKLVADNPKMLPEWKIDEKKDYIWNEKKVNNAVTQGIIQGERLDQISKRVCDGLVMQNENLSKTFARTAMTGAQNAGRMESLEFANDMGIQVYKQWMATLDSHTRDSHAHVDGESVPVDQKFSNGLEFPGDPKGEAAEVYNCRCTMVGDVKKYPAKYKRYNNEKGKPIQYMTYDNWAKSKSYGKAGYAASQGGKGKPIDYSKYGGKDTYDTLSKYSNYDDFVAHSTPDEFDLVYNSYAGKTEELKSAFKDIDKEKQAQAAKQAKKQEKQAEAELKKAQDNVAKLEKEIAEKVPDKEFENIWHHQTVTYADYEAKKDSIAAKEQYYNQMIDKYNAEGNIAMADKMKGKLEELKDFEKYGAEYSSLYKQLDEAKQAVKDLTPKPTLGNGVYTQERRDAAKWAKSPQEADKNLRSVSGEVWRDATDLEREAIYNYTSSYSKFNEPLRGWEYGESNYNTGSGFKGIGNTDLNAGHTNNGEKLNAMTSIISKSTYNDDIWLQRGCGFGGMDKFFNCSDDLLRNGTQKQLEAALLGTTPTEYGFMSCGSSKGRGFSGDVMLNIFTPSGTQMMYVEPFSAFGGGDHLKWDGISDQSYFGSELETILQQNTQFRVVKVERSGRTIYVDLDVIAQNEPQLWKKTR